MITVAALASYFENALNALIPSGENYTFKIWAEAGNFTKPYRVPNTNTVVYTINGQLSVNASAVTPNALVMGVNGLTLEFLVPVQPPKSSPTQPDSELAPVQNGQLYFIQQVSQILLRYFVKPINDTMTDENGNSFTMAMYSGVSISGVIDQFTQVGEAMPMSVSITLNFGEGCVNGLSINVYMDGEQVPYLTFDPSRSAQLTTDLQSNTTVQKHLSTSSAYAIQFTCPSTIANTATMAVYDYIASSVPTNEAHFVEIEWGEERDDIYLMLFTSANATVRGAEFAGLNANMGEAYQNEEYLSFPASFTAGTFTSSTSSATSVNFTVNSTFNITYAQNATIPESYPFYYYIGGTAYKLTATLSTTAAGSDNSTVATYAVTEAITAALNASDYAYDEDNNNYIVYLIASQQITVTNVSAGFTYEV